LTIGPGTLYGCGQHAVGAPWTTRQFDASTIPQSTSFPRSAPEPAR
jgi:hypothetical protein